MVAVLGVVGFLAALPSPEVDTKPSSLDTGAVTNLPSTSEYGRKVPDTTKVVEVGCATPPQNGEILFARLRLLSEGGHVLEIDNGSGRDAIVKARDLSLDQTQFSFFVRNRARVTIEGIPDGAYKLLFAFGDTLDAACSNFIGDHDAKEFPGVTTLETKTTSTEIITSVLSYTLHAVPSGNVHPKHVLEDVFDRD